MFKRRDGYPIGRSVTEAALIADPYPIYAALLKHEPVSWIECLNMWWVTRYSDISEILMDQTTFVTESGQSPIFDTFGSQMLSVEGPDHRRYKNGARQPLTAVNVRQTLESAIATHADALIDTFVADGKVELRSAFARRLPILVMLSLFGFPASEEEVLRNSYDSFESALANFVGDEAIRLTAQRQVSDFHVRLQQRIEQERANRSNSLLGHLVQLSGEAKLDDDEIKRNSSIVLFGGISTVEALILNCVWALSNHPDILDRVKSDLDIAPRVVEEVMRWQSPVQSATRYATCDTDFKGHHVQSGEIVNCMLGAGNRDPAVFYDPWRFDIDRPAMPRHLAFAIGPHVCLGMHLARSETRIAIERLYSRIPQLRLSRQAELRGYEFRKPEALAMSWTA